MPISNNKNCVSASGMALSFTKYFQSKYNDLYATFYRCFASKYLFMLRLALAFRSILY